MTITDDAIAEWIQAGRSISDIRALTNGRASFDRIKRVREQRFGVGTTLVPRKPPRKPIDRRWERYMSHRKRLGGTLGARVRVLLDVLEEDYETIFELARGVDASTPLTQRQRAIIAKLKIATGTNEKGPSGSSPDGP